MWHKLLLLPSAQAANQSRFATELSWPYSWQWPCSRPGELTASYLAERYSEALSWDCRVPWKVRIVLKYHTSNALRQIKQVPWNSPQTTWNVPRIAWLNPGNEFYHWAPKPSKEKPTKCGKEPHIGNPKRRNRKCGMGPGKKARGIVNQWVAECFCVCEWASKMSHLLIAMWAGAWMTWWMKHQRAGIGSRRKSVVLMGGLQLFGHRLWLERFLFLKADLGGRLQLGL